MPAKHDDKLRVCVKRLLSGDVRVDDITRLFLSLRLRSYGSPEVTEAGDFIAHSDTRSKGIATERVRDTFAVMRFVIPNLGKPLDRSRVPESFAAAVRANVRTLSSQVVKKDTGMRPRSASLALEFALRQLASNGNGTYRLPRSLPGESEAALRCYSGNLAFKPAFTEKTVASQFAFVLEKNRLIDNSQRAAILALAPQLALVVICNMHLCELVMDDGQLATLRTGIDPDGTVTVMFVLPALEDKKIHISSGTFQTTMPALQWCDGALLRQPQPWEMQLEIGAGFKLSLMG